MNKLRGEREFHDLSRSSEYYTWKSMRQRCWNPSDKRYPDYGGRGITIDPAWDSFLQFYRDMGPRPASASLDRIDNDGPYSPDNCRWASASEQQKNKRPQVLREACRNGHPYTAESTFYRKNGKRLCRICASASARARYQRKKAAS